MRKREVICDHTHWEKCFAPGRTCQNFTLSKFSHRSLSVVCR